MIPNYWKALIKKGVITEKDYFEKVEPCNVLIKRAKARIISDTLKDLEEFELKRYSDMIRTLKKIREKLEGKLK